MQKPRQCKYKRIIEARSRKHCCPKEVICVSYSQYVSVALFIQHAKRMRRIILSSAACLVLPHFSTLSHKRYEFLDTVTERTSVFTFSANFV